MKNALKAAVIIGGAMAIKEAVRVSFDSGMGFVIGMALTYEDGERITVDDAANDLMENGFSFGRVGYYQSRYQRCAGRCKSCWRRTGKAAVEERRDHDGTDQLRNRDGIHLLERK